MPKNIKPVIDEEQSEYEVEEVIGQRIARNGNIEYAVLWKGYSNSEYTWESKQKLENAKDKIKQYTRSITKSMQKKKYYSKRSKQQKKLYAIEKIQKIADLRQVLSKKDLGKNQLFQQGKITGFQRLLTKPPEQWIKVQRFCKQEGEYIQQLQQCGELIAKAAALEKRTANFITDQIQIISMTDISGEKVVKFEKNHRKYQCRLELLRVECPIEIVNFLLKVFNPAKNELQNETINLAEDIQKYN